MPVKPYRYSFTEAHTPTVPSVRTNPAQSSPPPVHSLRNAHWAESSSAPAPCSRSRALSLSRARLHKPYSLRPQCGSRCRPPHGQSTAQLLSSAWRLRARAAAIACSRRPPRAPEGKCKGSAKGGIKGGKRRRWVAMGARGSVSSRS